VAGLVGATAPVAAAEPTPFGEIGVGGIAIVGGSLVAASTLSEDVVGQDPTAETSVSVGGIQQSELETPEQPGRQSELPADDPSIEEASVPEDGEALESELQVPEDFGQQADPQEVTLSPELVGRQEQEDIDEEEEDEDTLGPDLDPFDRSDRRLRDPTRRFTGSQESVTSNVDEERSGLGESAEDIGTGITGDGEGVQPARDVETVEENFQRFLEEQQERQEEASQRRVLEEESVERQQQLFGTVESCVVGEGTGTLEEVQEPQLDADSQLLERSGLSPLVDTQGSLREETTVGISPQEREALRERQQPRLQSDTANRTGERPATRTRAVTEPLTAREDLPATEEPAVDAVSPFQSDLSLTTEFGEQNQNITAVGFGPTAQARGLRRLRLPGDEDRTGRGRDVGRLSTDALFASGIQPVSDEDLPPFDDANPRDNDRDNRGFKL